MLENTKDAIESCEFGLYRNDYSYNFFKKEKDDISFDYKFKNISDFPQEVFFRSY